MGQTGVLEQFVRGRRRGMVDGIDVIEFDLSYSNDDKFLKRMAIFVKYALGSIKIALRERYDLAFATTTPLTAGIPGIFAHWFRGKPFVFEVRDLWPELPRAMGVITNPIVLAAMSALEWISYRSAIRCVALSPGIARGIARRGVDTDRIATVPNGCDMALFRQYGERWRPSNVRNSDFLAVFTGSHGIANGLDAVLNAADVLRSRRRDDIKLLLIGDGKLKRGLVADANRRGLTNVIFHEPVSKHRLAGLLASADIGMQILANVPAFYYGTSPNKFFDYIAAGLPVLNNYPGWLAEMITDFDAGIVVPPDNAEAFADALERAANGRDALGRMGRNAGKLAQSFDRAKLSDAWSVWVTEGLRI